MQRKKKSKVTIYLDPDLTAALADFAARRDRSQSMIAEAAIASFVSPDDAERREAIVAKRLDQMDRRMTRVERDVGIAVESLAVFIRFWLMTTPALPEPAAKAAKANRPSDTRRSSRRSADASHRDRSCGRRLLRM